MLIEFTVKNFRSIKEEQTFSLVQGKGKELVGSNVFTPETPDGVKPLSFGLLKSAVIYGPNASGKSNFLKAMEWMQDYILLSSDNEPNIEFAPFLFDPETPTEPSFFEVIFLLDGIRYQYGFEATEQQVTGEWLFSFPQGRSLRWFEREFDADSGNEVYRFGGGLSGQKHIWQGATRSKALFLSTAVQLNSTGLKPIFDWFKFTLRYASLDANYMGYTFHEYQTDRKAKILSFLQAADLPIDDLVFTEEELDVQKLKRLSKGIAEQFEKEKTKSITKVEVQHNFAVGGAVLLAVGEESDGTRKMLHFAGPVIDVLEKGYVLFVDELHSSLHPKLVRYLIDLFHSPKSNPNGAQLIFTSHELSNLSSEVFRRDQVWFCEKNSDQATELFPLSDFRPRKDELIAKFYMNGRYGALPYINEVMDLFPSDETTTKNEPS